MRSQLPHVVNLASNSNMVLTGDFRLNLIKQKSAKINTQLFHKFQWHNITEAPSHITEKSSTSINLIMASNQSEVFLSGNISVGLSDHNLVVKSFKTRKIRVKLSQIC